ncbi:phage portal protein [Paludibacter sp. 221]|uniref:phage portal protein n=1 Tax=Paludibacter sp. 221 TaxID=2302939 RepID=UPI0013D361C5|nr:phage portal protein [Paludibacter sp. 221]NDV47850.1 phage portal protein [Paludibacter sp. 221]
MKLFNSFLNLISRPERRNQNFEELLEAGNISKIINSMSSCDEWADEAIREYNPALHAIMNRRDKLVKDKDGRVQRVEKRWKLPIPYQSYINEIALVFMYGRPVKWLQQSDDTTQAFRAFTNLIKSTRFDSKIRQCKRLAGSETQSAMLFRVFRNGEGKPDCQIRVLARSKGDDIRVSWDQYDNINHIGWGYYLVEGNKNVYHFDIFTPHTIYRCKKTPLGWDVQPEENLVGKIPVILFQQEKEWHGVEAMIEREEFVGSRTADTNDYFADPTLVLAADVIRNMPDKKEEAKVLIASGVDDIKKAAGLVTWDSEPVSKENEIRWLQNHILSKTFTPNIDFDNMKSLSNVSGKALKQMMVLADIKAQKRKETHDELLDRIGSLCKAIIGNVLDVSLKAECERLVIGHEFQEPFGDDITEAINNIVKLYSDGLMSRETAIELNPYITDPTQELNRINVVGPSNFPQEEALS